MKTLCIIFLVFGSLSQKGGREVAGGGFDGGVKASRRMLSPSGELPESCAGAQSSAEKGPPSPVCGDRKQSARAWSRGREGKDRLGGRGRDG